MGTLWSQRSVAGWRKNSAATAYLHPLIDACTGYIGLCRNNSDVLLNIQIRRLLASNDTECFTFDTALANPTCSSSVLLEYIRQHGVTINHGVGTANMSAYRADWGCRSGFEGKRGEGAERCGREHVAGDLGVSCYGAGVYCCRASGGGHQDGL